jgi:uncharacterized protein with PIN domain
MNVAWFRFYEELNEFLPDGKKKQQIAYSFRGKPSIKDAVEAMGVPHTEIDMILVNGVSIDFSYKLRNEDSVSVYPVIESLDISSVTHLREKPLRDIKFIVDVHLGKLAKYLRLCGFETHYSKDYDDNEIIRTALAEKLIILTHDLGILKNRLVTHGYWVRSQFPEEQLREVLLRFDLKDLIKPFTRCLICDNILLDVNKDEVQDNLLPKTRLYFQEYKKCPVCGRIYWKGSHFDRMKKNIEKITGNIK